MKSNAYRNLASFFLVHYPASPLGETKTNSPSFIIAIISNRIDVVASLLKAGKKHILHVHSEVALISEFAYLTVLICGRCRHDFGLTYDTQDPAGSGRVAVELLVVTSSGRHCIGINKYHAWIY